MKKSFVQTILLLLILAISITQAQSLKGIFAVEAWRYLNPDHFRAGNYYSTCFVYLTNTPPYYRTGGPNSCPGIGWNYNYTCSQWEDSLIVMAHRAGAKALVDPNQTNSSTGIVQWYNAGVTPQDAAIRLKAMLEAPLARIGQRYDGLEWDMEPQPSYAQASYYAQVTIALRSLVPGIYIPGYTNAYWVGYGEFYQALDMVNIMFYDQNWEGTNGGHNAPLYSGPRGQSSATSVMDMFERNYPTIPRSKISMAWPFYGRLFRGSTTFGVRTGGQEYSFAGNWQGNPSADLYHGLVRAPYAKWDSVAKCPYVEFPGDGTIPAYTLSYEDSNSLRAKVAWTKMRGYGGIGVWAMNEDYPTNMAKIFLDAIGSQDTFPPPPMDTTHVPPVDTIPATIVKCDSAVNAAYKAGRASVDSAGIYHAGFNAGKASVLCPPATWDTTVWGYHFETFNDTGHIVLPKDAIPIDKMWTASTKKLRIDYLYKKLK